MVTYNQCQNSTSNYRSLPDNLDTERGEEIIYERGVYDTETEEYRHAKNFINQVSITPASSDIRYNDTSGYTLEYTNYLEIRKKDFSSNWNVWEFLEGGSPMSNDDRETRYGRRGNFYGQRYQPNQYISPFDIADTVAKWVWKNEGKQGGKELKNQFTINLDGGREQGKIVEDDIRWPDVKSKFESKFGKKYLQDIELDDIKPLSETCMVVMALLIIMIITSEFLL